MHPPHARLDLIADASIEPLSLAQAKKYLRIDADDTGDTDDDEIGDMITAARMECELINDRSYITTTWQLTLDYLPFSSFGGIIGPAIFGFSTPMQAGEDGSIVLPKPPLIALNSISYVDNAGTLVSMDVTPQGGQVIVAPGTPGRISPAFNTFFPFARPTIASVAIQYTAGYGPDASYVPKTVMMAMRLLVSHYYEHRSTNVPVPDAVERLLQRTRWGGYA